MVVVLWSRVQPDVQPRHAQAVAADPQRLGAHTRGGAALVAARRQLLLHALPQPAPQLAHLRARATPQEGRQMGVVIRTPVLTRSHDDHPLRAAVEQLHLVAVLPLKDAVQEEPRVAAAGVQRPVRVQHHKLKRLLARRAAAHRHRLPEKVFEGRALQRLGERVAKVVVVLPEVGDLRPGKGLPAVAVHLLRLASRLHAAAAWRRGALQTDCAQSACGAAHAVRLPQPPGAGVARGEAGAPAARN
mmetsp:Transcript_39700/g.99800  ORF Transcript_39700/g.99800 Transcript_39700/m.99800 type:complete len:245 (-) Transcript_39700:115-849(-)